MSALRDAYEGVLNRIVLLQPLALPDTKNALPNPFHTQETWPYWTTRPGVAIPVRNHQGSRAVQPYDFDFIMRVVWGHLTSGFDGVLEVESFLDSAEILHYFTKHDMLADESAVDSDLHTPPRYLSPVATVITTDPVSFFSVGTVWQIATEFTLTATIIADAEELV